MDVKIAYLPVICISIRDSVPDQIKVDNEYRIDRLSIWIDSEGDSYGTVYDTKNSRVGEMMLSHFRCR